MLQAVRQSLTFLRAVSCFGQFFIVSGVHWTCLCRHTDLTSSLPQWFSTLGRGVARFLRKEGHTGKYSTAYISDCRIRLRCAIFFYHSLRASSPFGDIVKKQASERHARGDAKAGGRGEKGQFAMISHKFSFPLRKPQSATQPFLVLSRNAPPHKRLLRIEPHSFPFVFVV